MHYLYAALICIIFHAIHVVCYRYHGESLIYGANNDKQGIIVRDNFWPWPVSYLFSLYCRTFCAFHKSPG